MVSRAWMLLLACVASGLCCGSAPPPPPRLALDYATLGNHPKWSPIPIRLGVAMFESQPFYDRRGIAWRTEHAQGYYTTGKWADLPNVLFSDAVFTAAETHGAFASVQRTPEVWGSVPDLVVRGRIEAYEELTVGSERCAYVAVRAALTDPVGAATYWEGPIEHCEAVAGAGMDDLVVAFRAAQARVADALIAQSRRVAMEQLLFRQVSGAGGPSEAD